MTDEGDPFQELVDEVALAKNEDLEPVEEPFKPLIEDLGLEDRIAGEATEQILIYRESPNRRCFECGESIPETGQTLDQGEQYIIQRTNDEDEPFPLIERTFHTDCWEDYRR